MSDILDSIRLAQTYLDPFSEAAPQPKIPDDASPISLGTRCRQLYEVKSDFEVMPSIPGTHENHENGFYVVLAPGAAQNLVIYRYRLQRDKTTGVVSYVNNDEAIKVIYSGNNGCSPYINSISYLGATSANDEGWYLNADSQYAKYRVVSSGMRVSNVGSGTRTEGFWEARIVPRPELHNLGFSSGGDYVVGDGCYISKSDMYERILSDFTLEQSYKSGKIADLCKHQFNAVRLQHETDYVSGNEAFYLGEAGYVADDYKTVGTGVVKTVADLRKTQVGFAQAIDYLLHPNFMQWEFRIRNPAEGVRVLFEAMANYELIAKKSTIAHQFMSHSTHAPNIDLSGVAKEYADSMDPGHDEGFHDEENGQKAQEAMESAQDKVKQDIEESREKKSNPIFDELTNKKSVATEVEDALGINPNKVEIDPHFVVDPEKDTPMETLVKTFLGETQKETEQAADDVADQAINAVTSEVNNLKRGFGEAWDQQKEDFSNLKNQLVAAGEVLDDTKFDRDSKRQRRPIPVEGGIPVEESLVPVPQRNEGFMHTSGLAPVRDYLIDKWEGTQLGNQLKALKRKQLRGQKKQGDRRLKGYDLYNVFTSSKDILRGDNTISLMLKHGTRFDRVALGPSLKHRFLSKKKQK